MHASVVNDRFILSDLPYHRKDEAKEAGFHWSKPNKQWMCPANFISATAVVAMQKNGDDISQIERWMDGFFMESVVPPVFPGLLNEPMEHQRKGASRLLDMRRFGLFFDMACGKTMTALMTVRFLHERDGLNRVLIISPTSIFSVWQGEIKKHLGPHPLLVIWGTEKQRESAYKCFTAPTDDLLFAATSWDTLPRILPKILEAKPDIVIGDESSFIKNRKAARTKAAIEVADQAKYVTALSGTPYVSNITDLWSQLRFLSIEYAGASFWRFANRYIEFDRSPWRRPVGVRPGMEDELRRFLDSISMTVRKNEVLDLPEKLYQSRLLDPSPEQKKLLKDLVKEFEIGVRAIRKGGRNERNQRILIRNALTRVVKSQQVTMGWTKNAKGDVIHFRKNPKITALSEIFEESAGHNIVIFSRFIEDLVLAGGCARKSGRRPVVYHGGMRQENAERSKRWFQEGKADVFLSQVQKGGYGIDLTAADVCIYLSNWFSIGVRRQSEDRLHRPGQQNRVTYIDLLMRKSIDETIVEALDKNLSLSKFLFDVEVEEKE